ncbi:MAG: trypsin-like peptidase domain-containing protein [Candidatus Rokubacteria bacterium]|nr:trypsin-like peptidase domain-containing protein [Candidatus Rokubacteria bacterium]
MKQAALATSLVVWLLAHAGGPGPGAESVASVQEAILRAKPATVLVIAEVASEVTLDCGSGSTRVSPPPFRETGTGWFADASGWIVTNAHVVQAAHAPPRWLVAQQAQSAVVGACVAEALARRGIEPGQRPEVEEQVKRGALARVLPRAKIELAPAVSVLLSNGIRLAAKVAKYSPPVSVEGGPGVMSGRDLALLQVEASDMPVFRLAQSRNVKIGDPIRILGFPGVVLSHELLNASAKVEASVTNGAVSGFKQDVQNQAVIQTDAPAAWGNSGGPVVGDRGEVVGVLTFVSLAPGPEGSIVQGFNFVIPSDAVREFLGGTPVSLDGRSAFNEAWFTGLRRLFSGDAKGAALAFREANRLLPDLPDVKRALAEAEDKIKNPPPRPFPWAAATGAVTALSLGVFGGLMGLRWRRNRFRVPPSQLVRLLEAGSAPLVLDVRAQSAYDASPFRIPGSIRLSPDELRSGVGSLRVVPDRPVLAYCT